MSERDACTRLYKLSHYFRERYGKKDAKPGASNTRDIHTEKRNLAAARGRLCATSNARLARDREIIIAVMLGWDTLGSRKMK